MTIFLIAIFHHKIKSPSHNQIWNETRSSVRQKNSFNVKKTPTY